MTQPMEADAWEETSKPDAGPTEKALHEAEDAAQKLHAVIAQLRDNLDGVMQPEAETDEKAVGPGPELAPLPKSALTRRIDNLTEELRHAARRLVSIDQLVDVNGIREARY